MRDNPWRIFRDSDKRKGFSTSIYCFSRQVGAHFLRVRKSAGTEREQTMDLFESLNRPFQWENGMSTFGGLFPFSGHENVLFVFFKIASYLRVHGDLLAWGDPFCDF